ncbi:MAG: 30S ribosome-binding factor RbfA [Chloroflexi bacterium]|nr:30S ribosome-binding factor RbfA [Chloroflexota bacterium]
MSRRTQRINDLLREELSVLLQQHTGDPRLSGLLSITAVETSDDLRHAKVHVSLMAGEEERAEALRALAAASNFLRRELGHRLTLRRIPELSFLRDDSIERGARLLGLLRQVENKDNPFPHKLP